MKCSISLDTPSGQTEVLTLSQHPGDLGEFWRVSLIRPEGIMLQISFIILFFNSSGVSTVERYQQDRGLWFIEVSRYV